MQMQALPPTSAAPQGFHAIDIPDVKAGGSPQALEHPAAINKLFECAADGLKPNDGSMRAPEPMYVNRDSASSRTQAVHDPKNQEKCGCFLDTIGCISEAVTSAMISCWVFTHVFGE